MAWADKNEGDIAVHLDVTRRTVSKWTGGFNAPSVEAVAAVASLCDVPLWLAAGEPPPWAARDFETNAGERE